jgi:transcriptional regulator CtsR
MFRNKLSQSDLNRIIDLLFANRLISETNSRLTYEF